MRRSRQRLLVDRRGLSSLEYALLFVIIVVGSLLVWKQLGERLVCQMATGESTFTSTLGGTSDSLPSFCRSPVAATPYGLPAYVAAADGEKPKGKAGSSTTGSGTAASNSPPAPPIDPGSLPNTAQAAPAKIALPSHVNNYMQTSYDNSFPNGQSQERGATLIMDSAGNIRVRNEKIGTAGTFSPDRNVGAGERIIGTYHTHPYDKSEGGHKGVSFSGADIAYAAAHHEPIYVDAGNKQFMITPTKATNATSSAITGDWNTEYSKQLKAGKSMQNASAAATKAVAKKYDMAYYEGKNGTLVRVTP